MLFVFLSIACKPDMILVSMYLFMLNKLCLSLSLSLNLSLSQSLAIYSYILGRYNKLSSVLTAKQLFKLISILARCHTQTLVSRDFIGSSTSYFRNGKITMIVCRLMGDRCRVLHEQIDEELLKFIEVFIIHYDMTRQQGSQPKLLCPEYNSTVPSICVKYWFHIANQSSWINPKYIPNCTKSSRSEARRHAAKIMKVCLEILNLLIFISLCSLARRWPVQLCETHLCYQSPVTALMFR